VQAFLQGHLNSTATMADLLAGLVAQVSPQAGASPSPAPAPSNNADLAALAKLSQQYAEQFAALGSPSIANGPSSKRASNAAAALSFNPLAAWLHRPGYPYLTFEGGAAVQNGSAAPEEWAAAASQHAFCSWDREPENSEAAASSCSLPEGARWWLPLSASASPGLPLQGCREGSVDGSKGGFGMGEPCSSEGVSERGSSGLWVADPTGAGLYSTAYPEPYLQRLLEAVRALGPCYRAAGSNTSSSSSGGGGGRCSDRTAGAAAGTAIGSSSCGDLNISRCELDARPLLAAASVVSDTAMLAAAGAYPAARAFVAAQAAAQAPISATGKS
jgi:hypothetical protein